MNNREGAMDQAEIGRGRPDWERVVLVCFYCTCLPIAALWLLADFSSGIALTLVALMTIPIVTFAVAPLWLLAFVAAIVSNWRMGPVVLIRWLGIPMSGVLCLALVLNMVPLRIRFELSRAAFDQAVATHREESGTIGLFSIVGIDFQGDGSVYFTDADMGFLDPCGFAHTSNLSAPTDGIRDLGGGWWYWCDS
jgi:hypothetical protein